MSRIRSTLRPLTLLLSAALAWPAFAQSDIIQAAKDAYGRFESGQSPKSVPVAADGAVESWGDPAPARGADAAHRAAERLQDGNRSTSEDRKPTGKSKLRNEQRSDERAQDERSLDERSDDPRARHVAADDSDTAPRAKTHKRIAATEEAAPKKHSRAHGEDRYYEAEDSGADEPAPRHTSCTNVSRAWEGAAALSERGDEQRAYDAYLKLLSSCANDKELLGTVYQAQKNLSASALADLMNEPVMAAPQLQGAMMALKLQRMYQANKAKDSRTALALSREIRPMVLDSSDAGAMEVSGWLEQRARNPKVAEQLFRAALKVNRDAEGSRQGLVYALLAQGKTEVAAREMEKLDGANADAVRADVYLAQSRAFLTDGNFADSLKKLDEAERLGLEADDSVVETRAWALKGVGQGDKAAKLFAGLVKTAPDNADLKVGLVDSLYAAHDDKELQRLAAQGGSVGVAAKDALARRMDSQGHSADAARLRGEPVEGENGSASIAGGVRSKSGVAGEGRMTEMTIPTVAATVRVAEHTTVSVEGTHLRMSDEINDGSGDEVRVRVQTQVGNADVTVGAGASKVASSTKGTFEAKLKLNTESGFVEAGVSREPVQDSVRSYMGANVTVPVAGGGERTEFVGRVFDTNAHLSGSTLLSEANRYRLDWSVGAGSVSGENVYNNGYYRASAALTKDFENDGFSWLNVGPYVALQSYEHDENRFDNTYGGYFSPISDIGAGVMARALTREGGRSLYGTTTQMGYVSRGLYYGNDSGISLESSTQAAWLLGSNLILGAGVSLRSSPGYNDVSLKLGVTVPFESRSKLTSADLQAFKAQ